MDLRKSISTACTSFLLTNLDDLFVLVTFFAESPSSATLSPLTIALGQYLGFSIIIAISMLGYGLALVLPAEPIGFLGLLPILLGVWKGTGLVFSAAEEDEAGDGGGGDGGGGGGGGGGGEALPDSNDNHNNNKKKKTSLKAGLKGTSKVLLITVMNGGDNIGTYTPLFSQAKGADIAVYVVVYYLFLGVWLLAAFLIMQQKHVLRVAQKYARLVIPFLYLGLGIYIVVGSGCYPWAVEHIDDDVGSRPGKIIMGVVTAVLLSVGIGGIVWVRVRGRGWDGGC